MDAWGEARTKAPTRSAALVLALCLLVVATLVGGVRAVALAGAASDDASTLQLDGASLRVTSVDEVVGIAAADLMGGMAHNISGMVTDDQMMLDVSVRVTAGDAPATYDVRQIVARAAGSRATIVAAGGSLGSGFLSAHGRVEGSVTFVVPRNGAHLVLSVRGSPRSIDLAAVDQVAPGHAGHEHGTTPR